MKRILVVEDDPERIKWFKQAFIGTIVDCTKDVSQAIEWLKNKKYDILFLDNDLSEKDYSATGITETMGYNVSLFLEEHTDNNTDMMIIVHSFNDTMSRKIVQALRYRNDVSRVVYYNLQKLVENGYFDSYLTS